ncbi:hypothetical protein HIC20_02795 [Buchnera aphidicola (Hormaphis cornu)]|nr:hypothetical protein HIC20_02795 [Buchnera aphidicola (Hormaphis cornu)]
MFFCALTIKDIIKVTSLVEATAYTFDKRIINTEGTSFCSQMNTIIIGNSLGLLQNYKTTLYSMLTNMIARDKNSMQSDFKSTLARNYNDLENSKTLGIKVAQSVISKLLPKKNEHYYIACNFYIRN